MKKQSLNLASEVLQFEHKKTRFWFVSCVVVIIVLVLSHVVRGIVGNG